MEYLVDAIIIMTICNNSNATLKQDYAYLLNAKNPCHFHNFHDYALIR